MEPKEAIERAVIASAVLGASLVPKINEVKASYTKDDISPNVLQLPQEETQTDKGDSPEANYCEIPHQKQNFFSDYSSDWNSYWPYSDIGPQRSLTEQSEDKEEEIVFDPQKYDFSEFENYSLKSAELLPDNSIFQTVEEKVPLYLLPTNYDNDIQIYFSEIKQAYIEKGTNFDVAQIRVIENPDGSQAEIGVLSNTFKSRYVGTILMSIMDSDGNRKELLSRNESINATATAIMTEEETFPNEVINNLMAIKKIAEFQETNPFEAGKEYSYISLIGIDTYEGLSKYLVGFNNSNGETLAGGVCVTATALSSLLHQVEGATVKNTPHNKAYPQGPYSLDRYTIDSGIETYFDDKYNVDLKWKLPENGYLVFNINMAPSQKGFQKTNPQGVGGYSDVFFSYSVSFSKEKPQNQVQQIDMLLQEYQRYRNSRGATSFNINSDYKLKSFVMNSANKNICDLLYSRP